MRRATIVLFAPLFAFAASLALDGCSHASDAPDRTQGAPAAATRASGAGGAMASTARPADTPSTGSSARGADRPADAHEVDPPEPFTDGAKAFAAIKEAILTKYYQDGIREDDVWRAAARGVLEHVDPRMTQWNKLLAPAEVAEIRDALKGQIVGVGVEIDFDPITGHIPVRGVVPGSPAEKAGVLPGDLIVATNGKVHKGTPLAEVIADIRGKAGEPVTLTILREDKLITLTAVRALVTFQEVAHVTRGAVGYVAVRAFSARTAPMLKDALTDLASQRVRSLIVDLRANHGGGFDDAIACAEQLVPAGATIVRVQRRQGKVETIASKGAPILGDVPMAVVVDKETSSGAELIAAALQQDRRARLVGSRTFGKWTVQEIGDLPNGYAFKYTTSLFQAPDGRSFDGVGLTPDVEVDGATAPSNGPPALGDDRLAKDAPLRTALALLE